MSSKFAAAHQANMTNDYRKEKAEVWKRKGVKLGTRAKDLKLGASNKSPKLKGAGKKAKPKAGRKAK